MKDIKTAALLTVLTILFCAIIYAMFSWRIWACKQKFPNASTFVCLVAP